MSRGLQDSKQKIPVCFCCGKNYIQHLVVAITSVLESNSQHRFAFYILNADFGNYEKNIIKKIADKYQNSDFFLSPVNSKDFDGLKITDQTRLDISLDTYYRYAAADVITQYDKAIYLDCDLAVNGDLLPLYQIDLEKYYFAGVKELPLYENGYIYKKLGFSKTDVYVNAGVLLMNLKALRNDHFTEQFITKGKQLLPSILYSDQDIVNIVARGKIKPIDCIYNMTPLYVSRFPIKKYQTVVAHYVGKYKPWTLGECSHELAFLYFKYLEKSVLKDEQKVKNFCVYHKPFYRFENDLILPIQTGTAGTNDEMDMLQASAGDSIDQKNAHYGELTAWYWVYKNYLPQHPELEYIGFSQYRRMLNYAEAPRPKGFFLTNILLNSFVDKFNGAYGAQEVYGQIKDYDVILPRKHMLPLEDKNNEVQYLRWHPKKDLEELKQIIREDYPEYVPEMEEFFASDKGYYCFLFTMKKEIFISFMEFALDVLSKLEKRTNWENYTNYYQIRIPAFLMERFFNVWLEHNRKQNNWKILEREAYLLETSHVSPSDIRIGKNISLMKLYYQYIRFRLLSKITRGNKKKRYVEKKKLFKEYIWKVKNLLAQELPQ